MRFLYRFSSDVSFSNAAYFPEALNKMEEIRETHSEEMDKRSWDHDCYTRSKLICRTCGLQSEFLIPIFEGEGLQHHLDNKIQMYLNIQVQRDDLLPLQLCCDCVSTILSWHALFLKCQESEYKFRALLNSKEQFSEQSISLIDTSQHTTNPTHSVAQLFSSLVSESETVVIPSSNVAQNTIDSSAPHLKLSQSFPSRLMHTARSPMHFSTFEYEVSLPQTDPCTNVTNREKNSTLLETYSSIPYGNGSINVLHKTSASTLGALQTRELVFPALHASTQTDFLTDTKVGDECSNSLEKEPVIAKRSCREKPTGDIDLSADSNCVNPPTLLCTSGDNEGSAIANRVSAIRSISNSKILPSDKNSSMRSKSVLVRNESVHYSHLVPENEPKGTSSTETVVESAVIRKHQNICGNNDPSKGTMVSVVRPTCLRRAPTAVVVLKDIRGENQDERQHDKVGKTSEVFRAEQQEFDTFSQLLECEGVFSGSLDVPSPTSCIEEPKISNVSHSCFHCGKLIKNAVLLLSHERSHLANENPPTSFMCKFCSKVLGSLNDMHLHYGVHGIGLDKNWKIQSNRKGLLCKQCGLMCTTEERLATHQRQHVLIDSSECYKHECKTCGQTFNTRSKLSVHLWTHALKPSLKTFKCHVCGKGFATKSAVMEHCLKHTEEEKSHAFKCAVCGMAFGNNTLLGRHRSTHSEEELARPFKCSFCGKAFARNHTLQIHYFTHSDVKGHHCNQCGKSFKMRNSLVQHLRTHQDPSLLPLYPCQVCKKTFRVRSRLRDHLRLHSGDKPYKCATCSKCFHKIGALRTHEVSHTERRPYMCDVCGKAFKWSKNLRQHRSVHIGNDEFSRNRKNQFSVTAERSTNLVKINSQPCNCEICGKQLSGKNSLRAHLSNMHSGRLPKQLKSTSCSLCDKVLSTSGALIRHMKTIHDGVKAFKCDMCDRDYSTKVARDDHKRSHTGERPYSCSKCLKTFTSLSNLHIHRSSHSDDRPFKCSFCEKQFKRRAHLVPHIRIHTGEKPYVCNICSRGFVQSNDLQKHRLIHSIDKAFACHCGRTFRVKTGLNRHVAKHHPYSAVLQNSQSVQVPLLSTSDANAARLHAMQSVSSMPALEVSAEEPLFASSYHTFVPNYDISGATSVVVINSGAL